MGVRQLCHAVVVIHNQWDGIPKLWGWEWNSQVVHIPLWLGCAISVSFSVSLPSSRLFILMLFKEEIKSLKSSDLKCRKIEF